MRLRKSLWLLIFALLCSVSSSDERSGPGRTTLETFDGGTIYAVNSQVTDVKTELGETTLITSGGRTVIKSTPSGYDIVGPKGTLKLSASMNDLSIQEGNKSYKIKSEFGGKTVLSFPGKKITFQQGSMNEVTISGPKGTLKVEDQLSEVKLESPAGTTVYSGNINGQQRTGPPMERHPYTYRAYLLERNGVGIMLDLLPYQPGVLKPLLDWARVKYLQ